MAQPALNWDAVANSVPVLRGLAAGAWISVVLGGVLLGPLAIGRALGLRSFMFRRLMWWLAALHGALAVRWRGPMRIFEFSSSSSEVETFRSWFRAIFSPTFWWSDGLTSPYMAQFLLAAAVLWFTRRSARKASLAD
jgi:hypothetical protein